MKIWDKIPKPNEKLQNPNQIIEKLYDGLDSYSKGKLSLIIDKVNFFPEEVTYSGGESFVFESLRSMISASSIETKPRTKNPHPEFGYNPDSANNSGFLRYRILIKHNIKEFEYELFKIKYPILFYPVKFFLDKISFSNLKGFFTEENLFANNENELREIITNIITSEEHINLLQRIYAI